MLTFGSYMWLLRSVPAYRLSLISYVSTVIALLLGRSVRDELVGSTTLLGTALVLSGVAFTLRKKPRAPVPAASE